MVAAVFGAGAIGAVIAESLHQYYGDTCFAVADSQRAARYRNLTLNGKRTTFPWRSSSDPVTADLVIIAVKGYHLEGVIETIRPWTAEHTQIISLLNGITSEQIIGRAFGRKDMLLSLAVGQDAVRRGSEVTYTRKGKILLGEASVPSASKRAEELKNMLVQGGVQCEIPCNMKKALWWKFMVNTGINQVSAVLDAPYKAFQQPGKPREMMLRSIEEVRMIAGFEGIALTDADVAQWLDLLDTLSPEGETSMLQDVRARRKTEVDLFAGTLINLAEKHGAEVPFNRELYQKLGEEKKQS